jgi:TonB family protein
MERKPIGLTLPVVYSLLFHAGLAVALAFTVLTGGPVEQEFFELALAQAPPQGTADNPAVFDRSLPDQQLGADRASFSQVNLPKKRMLNDPDQITVPAFDDKQLDASRGTVGDKIAQTDQAAARTDRRALDSAFTAGKRGIQEYAGDATAAGKTFVYGSADGTADKSFQLEWLSGGKRRVLEKYLPSYPPGLQKELAIKLRFVVLPDGSLDQVRPVKKGDPQLEDLTLKAFNRWKFEPLSAKAEQKPQAGMITFTFRLK